MSDKPPRFRLAAAIVSLALLTGLIAFGSPPTPAAAVPGNPGTPGEPTVLYEEDFENSADATNTLLSDYESATGIAYSADPYWASRANCNGFIIDRTSPRLEGDCGTGASAVGSYNAVTAVVDALGQHQGATGLNTAVASYTAGDGANNAVQFRTDDAIQLAANGRFVTFSVDAGAMNCFATHPQLRFYLDGGDGEQPLSGAAIDPCTDPRAVDITGTSQNGSAAATRVGTFPGDRAVLLTGGEFDIVLRNENGNGRGNDGAYDNIRVLDVTPQLDKSFGPETVLVDGRSTLTFTVTNTSELGAKNGWSFTDNLPEGLVAAEPTAIGGTCAADTTIGDDGASVSVANGVLAAGTESCTITVAVTSDTAGTYENCAENISDQAGIDLPACASVTFETQQDFQCAPQGILFQYPGNVPPTQVIGIDVVTGAASTLGSIENRRINAIAYNVLDDYIYGLDLHNTTIVRVGGDASAVPIGWPEGLPHLVVGDIDEAGRYWVTDDLNWHVVDLAPGSSSYGTVVDQGQAPTPAGLASMGADWAYVPGTDALWSIGIEGSNAVLVKFDRATRQKSVAANLGVLGGNTFGAVYADPNGFLYGSDNVTGQIFRVDVAAGTAQKFSDGPSSGTNDGARCAEAPIPIDFGDAPDSYGTTLADDGPRHSIPGIDVQSDTAPLMLGSKIDIDVDGVPSDAADADDTAEVADEDGVTKPVQLSQTGPTTVSVTATNTRDVAATLAGWIDLDGNGTFDASELVTATVPAGSGTATYPLEFGEFTGEGTTYARFRLYGSTGATPSPTGPAGAGEVEDYVVEDRELTIEKNSTATEATRIGDTVKYSVTVSNTGTAAFTEDAPAIIADDLSGVLDDATYNGDVDATSGEATVDGNLLRWRGAIEPGGTVTITYTVTTTGAGDAELINVAFQPECDPAAEDCEPVTPPPAECDENGKDPKTGLPCDSTKVELPRLTVEKAADTTAIPEVGQTVTYTVKATNDGKGAFTAADPAVVIDDLSGVLDDATVDPATLQADRDPAAAYAEPRITWTGALAPGETVTITYQVTYTGAGDHKLINVAFQPEDPDNPEPPACDPADENGLDPETGQPCFKHQIPAAGLTVEKSVDPADGSVVNAGQEVTYTITFGNDGETDAAVNEWIDDLSDVLDDAELITGPTSSGDALSVSEVADGRFTVNGSVAVGETVTVTYTVKVLPDGERGNNALGNVVGKDPSPGPCEENDPLCTSNPIPHLVDSKSVAPETGSTVDPGQQLTYTLTFGNDGTGAGQVDRVDDLGHLLDDADVTGQPTSSDPALSVSMIENGRFAITGELEPGQTVTVTYTVTVRGLDDLGDGVLANFLLDPDEDTPDEPVCEGEDCTANPIARLRVSKSADPSSGAQVEEGQRITYTLTFENEGSGDADIDHTDHLAGVLDDADVITSAKASDPALTVLDADDQYTVQGTLAAGQTVTVSYVVEVRAADDQGDGQLANFLTETGQEPPAECNDGDPSCTTHETEPPGPELPDTGAPSTLFALLSGLVLLAVGGVTVARSRRNKR
ncbi:DUF7927 domain-containing protein [Microlunatus parietis]|uniref:Fimbrial isopeptide formation D2 family protein/uncharacterized repeat protein (TIGR01451 family)/LPXTG-motif cell wall-anchored protein n=1 Tax=Microlunatus parietis TaxID=682979 RepID=A0A7Y9ICG1_9ACTN|nr:GEVED domain-containing protein [Microlunatus parietis]NYE74170.1 fimbrial isopeptide formation D2 family protein/uncharacterized repeat protein (TIGR01451 family)/LPXTG-motif cell wall-anchored protein [Microlunatus parietis]